MIVDILHRSRRNPGLLKGQADGAGGLLSTFLQTYTVVGFAGGAITGDLAVNVGATSGRALQFFQNKKPRALGQDKSVAVARERPGGPLGSVIPARRHDAHELKAA